MKNAFLQINDLRECIEKVLQDIRNTFLVKLPGAASWTVEEFMDVEFLDCGRRSGPTHRLAWTLQVMECDSHAGSDRAQEGQKGNGGHRSELVVGGCLAESTRVGCEGSAPCLHQCVFWSARRSAGAREADRGSPVSGFGLPLAGARFDSARRPHEVDRSEAGSGLQFASPSELEVSIKTALGPFLWVCVFVAPVH